MVPRNVAESVRALGRPPRRCVRSRPRKRVACSKRSAATGSIHVLAFYAGMRQGELLALKWQDVGLENDRLSVRRTITVGQGRILLGEPKTKT